MTTLVGWWIYQLTNAAFAIGLVGLSEVIPAVSFALYAGHVIDISEKDGCFCVAYFYICRCRHITFLSAGFTKEHLSSHSIAICIYAVIFCTGIIRSFTGPVFNVILAQIVPKSVLQNATTWNQGAWLLRLCYGSCTGRFVDRLFWNYGRISSHSNCHLRCILNIVIRA